MLLLIARTANAIDSVYACIYNMWPSLLRICELKCVFNRINEIFKKCMNKNNYGQFMNKTRKDDLYMW